jgi:hypothetical protein
MTQHVHSWEVQPDYSNVTTRYRCACGAWGYRSWSPESFKRTGGRVREYTGPGRFPKQSWNEGEKQRDLEFDKAMRERDADDERRRSAG